MAKNEPEVMDEHSLCLCDHELGDHDEDLACTAEGCVCSYFAEDEEA